MSVPAPFGLGEAVMGSGYTGWKLPADERGRLLAQVPPRYERLVADHVTLQFGAGPQDPLPTATLAAPATGRTDRPTTSHGRWPMADGRSSPTTSSATMAGARWIR